MSKTGNTENKSDSPAYQLLDHVWQHARSGSFLVLNQSLRTALSLAISSGMKFAPEDFSRIYRDFRGGSWFGEEPERYYSSAVTYRNISACQSWENYTGRKPLVLDGQRLHLDAKIGLDLLPELTDRRWSRVTSFDQDGQGLIVCVTEWSEEKKTTVVRKRIHLSRTEVAELERGLKARKAAVKAEEKLECSLCGKKYRRGDRECACTKDLPNCVCGKRKWTASYSGKPVCERCWEGPVVTGTEADNE